MDEIVERLTRWEDAGLITAQQRSDIQSFETERAQRVEGGRVSVVEALIHLSIIALVLSLIALVGDTVWEEAAATRVAVILAIVTGTGVLGAELRRRGGAPFKRAASLIWLISAMFAFGLGSAIEGPSRDGETAVMFTALPVLVFVAAYWVVTPTILQLIGLLIGAIATGIGIFDLVGEVTTLQTGATLIVVGAATLALGLARAMRPVAAAESFGALLIVLGFVYAGLASELLWVELLGIVASVGLLWLSTVRAIPSMLMIGAVGVFSFVTGTLLQRLDEQLGTAATMLLVGVSFLGIAGIVSWLLPMTRGQDALHDAG